MTVKIHHGDTSEVIEKLEEIRLLLVKLLEFLMMMDEA